MTKSRQKFVELAEKRVSRAIRDIRLIGNLSNKTNYSYTAEDSKKIVKALRDEIELLKARFGSTSNEVSITFKLD